MTSNLPTDQLEKGEGGNHSQVSVCFPPSPSEPLPPSFTQGGSSLDLYLQTRELVLQTNSPLPIFLTPTSN
jgi:hypothetical protein